jgi:hypothetical protein
MTFQRLLLTGPGGQPYLLGQPIEVFDGAALIGRVQSVTLSPGGDEVRIENFLTTDMASFRARALPKLVLAEVVSFIAERYRSIHAILIELSRDIEGFEGREAMLASVRADILHSIGAVDVCVVPKPHPDHAAHFAVHGVWRYDESSVAALAAVLEAQRAAYRTRLQAADPPRPKGLRRLLRSDSRRT